MEFASRVGRRSRLEGLHRPRKDADFVVWDPDAEVLVGDDGADGWPVEHKHPTTPWRGRRLRGRVISTFLRGELVYERRPTDGAHEHRAEGPYGRPSQDVSAQIFARRG